MKAIAIGMVLAASFGSAGCFTGQQAMKQEYLTKEPESKPKKPAPAETAVDPEKIDESNAADSVKQLQLELSRESMAPGKESK